MAFSELVNRLIPEGAVMAGATPKTILADGSGPGSEPGYYDTSPLGNLLRRVEQMQAESKIKQQEQQKKINNRIDTYKTLRDAGYDPKKAYEAVIANDFPSEPGGETSQEKKDQATIDYTKKKTDILPTSTKSKLHSDIQQKVANGETLTPGEQRIYDEVIRKYGNKSDLSEVVNSNKEKAGTAKKTTPGKMVPMINPAGQKKLVPAENVERAKAAGWKTR